MPFLIIITIVAYQALLILIHLAVYATFEAAFGVSGLGLRTGFILLAVAFPSALLISLRFAHPIARTYYKITAYGFGLIHFLFTGALVFVIIEGIFRTFGWTTDPPLVGGLCFGAFFILHTYSTWQSGRAKVTKIMVALPGLPSAWRGKKVVFVSDVHLGNVRGKFFARKVVRKIQAIAPEAVFIGGDLYDGGQCDPDLLAEPFRSLSVPKGTYFISGNHEYYLRDPAHAFQTIRDSGMRILDNEKVDLNGIEVIGVDYEKARRREDFKKVLSNIGVDRKKPTILLKHEPDNLDVAEEAGISLGLYGHTHRGQIWPLLYITRIAYKGYDYGFKKFKSLQVYTSSGVGTWGPPLRLGTKSEIVEIQLI